MGISKITRNFQVTLPKDIRKIKGLKEGDSVIFSIEGNNVGIIKADKNVIKEAAGLWSKTKDSSLEYERKVRSGWQARLKRETE
mgnify:CR=1 FL=1